MHEKPEELDNNQPNRSNMLVEDVVLLGLGLTALSGAAELLQKHLLSRDALGLALGTYVVGATIIAAEKIWPWIEDKVESRIERRRSKRNND